MVTLVEVVGSSPQDVGSKMLVTKDGLHGGTIGGGKVEFKAINEAKILLENKILTKSFVAWNLKKDVGMSCGGIVSLYFEAFHTKTCKIAVFGAGHVANALIPQLLLLECQIRCLDHYSGFGFINCQNRLNYHLRILKIWLLRRSI